MENTKKANVLLVYPDYFEWSSKSKNSGGNYSEGLASISAVLKAAGHSVSLLHLFYSHTKEEFQEKIRDKGYDLIGFSTRTTAFEEVQQMAIWTKEATNAFVYCGGYHCTLVPDEVLACEGIDAVCIGEGEYPTRELCDRFFEGNFYDIQSMYFKVNGEIIRNPVAPMIEDLDELPIPDFDLFDYPNLEHCRTKTAIVMMSRGCLFSCTYCGNSQFRQVYPNKKHYARFRSPENAIMYLETLLEKYPWIEFINFRDAIFNMYSDWFDTFIEMYKERIHLPFTGNLRLDIMTEDTVRRMAEAGCYMIDVGVESGDEEIRRKYLRRMMTDEQMKNAFSWFRKYGITSLTYNIVGLPHEDLHKALKTVKLNVDLNADRVIPNIFYPYPMTVLHDIAKEAGFVPDVIPPDTKVALKQENFPEHEVLFASNYFLHFLKSYKRARKMPKWLGKRYEKWLDRVFVSKYTPRKFLNFCSDVKSGFVAGIKRFLVTKMPNFYVWLRRVKNGTPKTATK